MEIYGIATKHGNEPLNWYIPNSNFIKNTFFKSALSFYKKQVSDYINDIHDNTQHVIHDNESNRYLYIQKYNDNYAAFITNKSLTTTQIIWLTISLIERNIPLKTVAMAPERYMSDPKIFKLKGQLSELKDVMLDNLDKTLERGEKLENLQLKVERLAQEATVFKKEAKKLNSCWSKCTIL